MARPPKDGFPNMDEQETEPVEKLGPESETINLNEVGDVSLDPSIRPVVARAKGRVVAKLLNCLPSPLFLIGQRNTLRFLNRSSEKIDPDYKSFLGGRCGISRLRGTFPVAWHDL